MTTHAYTEDQLVEQPAIGLFGVLGWQTASALEETTRAGRQHPLPPWAARQQGRGGARPGGPRTRRWPR
jgi:hypothetical protein